MSSPTKSFLKLLNPIYTTPCPAQLSSSTRRSASRSGSSHNWLARQRKDPYVRARGSGAVDSVSGDEAGAFVARSAFKLIELQRRWKLLGAGMTVVDLGAAPGGWVQVAAKEVMVGKGKGREGAVVAVDLLPLNPDVAALPGVFAVQGNFLDPVIKARVVALLQSSCGSSKCDLVLSDLLANMSGNSARDAQSSIDLCEAALSFARDHLKEDDPTDPSSKKSSPSLVMKCLQSGLTPAFQETLRSHFRKVRWDKPSSSRPESREGYWVCSGLKVREGSTEQVEGSDKTEDGGIFF